jgi:hypothetical protein
MLSESYIIGFKEGLKIGIVWLVSYSCLVRHDRRELIVPFYRGLLLSLILCIIAFFFFYETLDKGILSNIISTSFAVFFILSAAALFHAPGINLLIEIPGVKKESLLINIVILSTTIVFFLPDMIGSLFFLREVYMMRDNDIFIYVNSLIGLGLALLIVAAFMKLYRPYRIGELFSLPQFLLFLAVVKLLGSGIRGYAELSLIPSVQRGFMKFTHDFVHQVLVLIMVPDHPLLKTTTWNFIGILFGANLASIASLILLLFFPLLFVYYSMFGSLPEPGGGSGPQRRKAKSGILSDRRKKTLPVLVFITLILITWFSQKGETVLPLHVPKARPVVEENGYIMIPLNDPSMDLYDGSMHKFSLIHMGEELRIFVLKKPDASLSVHLDACEICPPEGYGQRAGHVVCLYCSTPITISSLGQPGGCNPIPLSAEIGGEFIKIKMDEILKKRGFLKVRPE